MLLLRRRSGGLASSSSSSSFFTATAASSQVRGQRRVHLQKEEVPFPASLRRCFPSSSPSSSPLSSSLSSLSSLSALASSHRCVSSVSAQELQRALRTLGLTTNGTDAEIKAAFGVFAKANHPDTSHPCRSASNGGGNELRGRSGGGGGAEAGKQRDASTERMMEGTAAYQLLRTLSFDERQWILRDDTKGGWRQRASYKVDDFGPGGSASQHFCYTEAEYAKAQAAYAGRPRGGGGGGSRRRTGVNDVPRSGRHAGDEEDGGLFDSRTREGRRRTAEFNKFTSRVETLRRRAGRDAAPWKVADGDGTYHHRSRETTPPASYITSAARRLRHAAREARRRGGVFRTSPHRFVYRPVRSLRLYLSRIKADLRVLRAECERDKTFAGIHGDGYASDAQQRKLGEELRGLPQLRQYLLLRQRAQERAVVDGAVGRLVYLLLFILCTVLSLLVAVATTRTRGTVKRYEAMKAQQEARGGG